MLADNEPFERVMQRINFVEAEIMMRLADDRLGLALEALRAEASISLPNAAGRLMLEEIDKIAASGNMIGRDVRSWKSLSLTVRPFNPLGPLLPASRPAETRMPWYQWWTTLSRIVRSLMPTV